MVLPALSVHEALSGAFGSISLAAWIFLLVSFPPAPQPASLISLQQVPQLVENYRQKSAQGISLTFLTVWFIGDVANLVGALWAHLVPTVIALAIYFCIADTILIAQCVYYNTLNAREEARRLRQASTISEEEQPLLSRRASAASESNIGLPGSHRRKSSAGTPLAKISEDPMESAGSAGKEAIKNVLAVLIICGVGALGWFIAYKAKVWEPQPEGAVDGDVRATPLGAEIFGYFSAVCYLGARIPQIVKNARERSCDGLSLLFFMLSVLGNLTYGAGVSVLSGCCQGSVADQLSTDSLPLAGEGVCHDQSTLAHWISGHDGRGCNHLCAVLNVWREAGRRGD